MEQRLIDANALKATIRPADSDDCRNAVLLSDVRKILHNFVDNAPTVDAVEVVRCKECKYYEPCEGGKDYCCWHESGVVENDFCSYGERRDSDG